MLRMIIGTNSQYAELLFLLVAEAGTVEDEVLVMDAAEFFSKNINMVAPPLVHSGRDMDVIHHQWKATTYNNYLLLAQQQVNNNIRRLFRTLVEDCRCVVRNIAERIVYLRDLKDSHENQRVLVLAAVKESIHMPLANRLGWEFEDCCFRYLYPDQYKRIAKFLHERRTDREQYIENFVISLRKAMQEEGLKADIYGRPKHIYSIWRKMQEKSLKFDELFDVRAVRVVVEHLQDCYVALGIAHTHFRHLPYEFDDYVANPKPNGYQSIHTVVLGPLSKTLEIQIRTRYMHEYAELGVAAHWKYKAAPQPAPTNGGRFI